VLSLKHSTVSVIVREGIGDGGNTPLIVPTDTQEGPEMFIKIVSHSHDPSAKPIIISLDTPRDLTHVTKSKVPNDTVPNLRPWAPFLTLADFEYAESAVTGHLSRPLVNTQLHGMAGGWAEKTNITFRNYDDMKKSLAAAREFGIKVSFGCFVFY
jgi:hypothetical protein